MNLTLIRHSITETPKKKKKISFHVLPISICVCDSNEINKRIFVVVPIAEEKKEESEEEDDDMGFGLFE